MAYKLTDTISILISIFQEGKRLPRKILSDYRMNRDIINKFIERDRISQAQFSSYSIVSTMQFYCRNY